MRAQAHSTLLRRFGMKTQRIRVKLLHKATGRLKYHCFSCCCVIISDKHLRKRVNYIFLLQYMCHKPNVLFYFRLCSVKLRISRKESEQKWPLNQLHSR